MSGDVGRIYRCGPEPAGLSSADRSFQRSRHALTQCSDHVAAARVAYEAHADHFVALFFADSRHGVALPVVQGKQQFDVLGRDDIHDA